MVRGGDIPAHRGLSQSAAQRTGWKAARSPGEGSAQKDEDARVTDGLRALNGQSEVGRRVLQVGEEASYRVRSFIDTFDRGPGVWSLTSSVQQPT
jgi:hypothetical protein